MPSLTIRNISEEVLDKIRYLSELDRRSMNSEILYLLESGLMKSKVESNPYISKEAQLSIWNELSGTWEDSRNTKEIIGDIYSKRSKGRNVDL